MLFFSPLFLSSLFSLLSFFYFFLLFLPLDLSSLTHDSSCKSNNNEPTQKERDLED